jgi:prepilin-type N-terminal cleavage/methylation domain-containing protein/prepilin-type processing-associated H-X9-DG protein
MKRAFTLIELLAVCLILGLLASLLFPLLARGRSSAYFARCTGNLRQLGLAAQLYWDDHDGRAFRWRGDPSSNGQTYWFGWIGPGQEGGRQFDQSQGALYPYLQGSGIELCPAFDYLNPRFKLKATGASYGYGYNLSLSTPRLDPPLNINRIKRPSQTALFADAAQINTFQSPASPGNPMIEEFYYINHTEPTVHFRHNERAVTAFCDGHVERERPEPNSLDLRLPNHMVGRIRANKLMLD